MNLRIGLALSATLCVVVGVAAVRLAYERGSCDIAIGRVAKELLRNEVRALVDPQLRNSAHKRLRFDLYTRRNPQQRHILRTGDAASLRRSHFNASWPVRFSIHGWMGMATSCSNAAIKDAYLARGNFNVILVDWSAHSLDVSYARITAQLPAIAAHLVKFARFLEREAGAPFEHMYLVGHSAGSHIAGLAGKLLRPQRFGVIFALDPAGLTQLRLGKKHRLAASDAIYVESIHTDLALLGNPNTDLSLSHAAFFPNWGQGQPQCPNATSVEFDIACDHFAALYYFAESVRAPRSFGALRCGDGVRNVEQYNCICPRGTPSCQADTFMGGEPAVPKRGVFYLSTTASGHGLGSVVRPRRPIPPTILESSFLPPLSRMLGRLSGL